MERTCKVCGVDFESDDDLACSNVCEIRDSFEVFNSLEYFRFRLKGVTGDDFREAMEGLIEDLGLK